MSPRACSSLVPVNSVGLGWTSSTSQDALPLSSRRSCSSGSNRAIASATSRSTVIGPQPARSASRASTHRAASRDSWWVCWAARRACHAGISKSWTRRHNLGNRWVRSRASASSCAPAAGDMPIAAANGSGVNAATAGVPSPPSDSSRPRTPGRVVSGLWVATPVSAVAGCSTHQCTASSRRRSSTIRASRSVVAAAASTMLGSRSSTLLMGSTQPSTTDTEMPQNPLSTRDSSFETHLLPTSLSVRTTAVSHKRPRLARQPASGQRNPRGRRPRNPVVKQPQPQRTASNPQAASPACLSPGFETGASAPSSTNEGRATSSISETRASNQRRWIRRGRERDGGC